MQSPWSMFYSATDSKPARTDRLCKVFVEVCIQALECRAVKAIGNDACVAQPAMDLSRDKNAEKMN